MVKYLISLLFIAFLLQSCASEKKKADVSDLPGNYTIIFEREAVAEVLKQQRLDPRAVDMAMMMVEVKLSLTENDGVLTVDAGLFNDQIKEINKPVHFDYEIRQDTLLYGKIEQYSRSFHHLGVIRPEAGDESKIAVFLNKNKYFPSGAKLLLEKKK